MIRVRRASNGLPLMRFYEIEIAATADSAPTERLDRARRGDAVRRLEQEVGTGDAWSFLRAADEAWDKGDRSWAVEYQAPA